jgi:hypothetical protein
VSRSGKQIIAAGIVIESSARTESEAGWQNTVQVQNISIKNVFPIFDSINASKRS